MRDSYTENSTIQARRTFLLNTGMGLGTAAFASLVPKSLQAAATAPRSATSHAMLSIPSAFPDRVTPTISVTRFARNHATVACPINR